MFDSVRTTMPEYVIFLRFVLAVVLGGLVGLDRELKNRSAGLRTHMLIALGAAVFTIITFELITDARLGSNTKSDPGRIVEAVTSGVAFLAAGSIVLSKGNVSGVTTGASMWLAAAIGVACGAGDYSIAVMATLLTMFVLAVVAQLQPWLNPASADVDKVEKPESGQDP